MNKQLATWQFIHQNLAQHIPVVLLYVLQSEGSSPGRQGFFMGVNALGEILGSIGGGIMEHKLVQMAKSKLQTTSAAHLNGLHTSNNAILKHQVHDKSAAANQSGMICSGQQTILIYQLLESDIHHILNMMASLEMGRNGTLLLSSLGIQFQEQIPEKDFECTVTSTEEWYYKEKTGYKNRLYIIGGGHCALALSKLFCQMDFYITVYEERPNLNTVVQNTFAHEIILVKDYLQLTQLLPDGANHYIVIMTVGYRTDLIALQALLQKKVAYLGVLGSKKKMEKLLSEFESNHPNSQKLLQIFTPIGLRINSQTPEEIAISIASEIIQIKNR